MPLFEITEKDYALLQEIKPSQEQYEQEKAQGCIIEDGFGSACSIKCSQCGEDTMFCCRPGDFRCHQCG